MANLLSTIVSGRLSIGSSTATPYLTTAPDGIVFGGNEVGNAYRLYTDLENYGGNYTKLNIAWHTGIKIGAYYGYGGTRFYNNSPSSGTEIFSVGKGDNHVRVENNLYVGNTIYNNGNAVIHAGNIGSQSVNYAASAGNANTLDSLDSSDFARGRAAYQVMSLDDIKQPGLYQYDGGIGGTQPEGADQANLRTIEIGSGSRYSQMAFDWASDQAWFRRQTGDVWSTWREFIHSGNIGSQSVNYATTAGSAPANGGTSTYATYLNPLSGDSNYKLAYTADGARNNAGEWGRAVMYYVPNGQTYGIRVDRADYADSAGAVAWGNVSSKPSNIMYYQSFTLDANTMDPNSTGFTYAVNAPFYGPVARFSTGGGYDLWIGGSYGGGGNAFYLRTRNGDAGTFNAWREIITSGNIASQSVSYADESGYSSSSGSVEWTSVQNKPSTFPPSTHNHDDRYLVKGGSWYGSGLPGSRWGGFSVSGGEIVFGDGLPNAGQMGILIDGAYLAGENNGFWSLASDNSWSSRRGMYWDGSNLNFTANSPTALFNSIRLSTSTNNGTISGGGDWGIRFANDNGWIQFGPANNSWTHIYSDKNFYMNTHLWVSGGYKVTAWDYNNGGGALYATVFYDANDTGYYLDPNGTSNLLQLNTSTRARWNMPRWWNDRSSFASDENYWTGTNGWGTGQGTWANAWKGGFSGWDIWGTGTDHPQGGGYVHAQGIVFGQHYASSDGGSGYGWMMVGAADAITNRYWLRGKWGSTTSAWTEIMTSNQNTYAWNMDQWVRTTDSVSFAATTSPTFLVNSHSDNTKGYRIHNTSGTSVSAMFTNSSNQLVIAAGAVDQINLNKKVYVNGVALGVNVTPSATAGRIDASNDIVAYSSSDERLKYNITPIENALDKVKSLTGVEFDWKPEYKHAHGYEGHDTGIIAQQVQEVIPSAVRTNDTGFLAVRYEKLIGLLIEANKELAARVEELEKKLG